MQRISINNNWEFIKLPQGDANAPTAPDTGYEPVSVPHTWYSDDDQYRGLALYRKSIKTEKEWKNVFLEFCGADQNCKVYVNNIYAGEHKGAYATFRIQVPEEALTAGTLNVEVFLTNVLDKTISPITGDFTIYGGLYRDVNLLVTEDDHFDYMYYGTDGILLNTVLEGNQGIIHIEPHAITVEKDAMIQYEISDKNGNIVTTKESKISECVDITILDPAVWDGRNETHLYKVCARLLVNGQVVDQTVKKTGFRSFKMTADHGFYLNGVKTRLNGVSKHQDYAEVFSAITPEHTKKDFKLIDEIGANAVRLSHYQHAQEIYELCDSEGYIVWAEIPMLKMTEDRELLENAEQQLTELILQNMHHPSILFWGIQNEIGMFMDAPFMHEECRKLTSIAKELDPTRLVTAANLYTVKYESELNNVTDMIGYNLYYGWYYGQMTDYDKALDQLHKVRNNMPVGMSEYGVDASPFLHSDEPKVKDYSEEYQALYHETVYPIFKSKEYLWGSFVWNMFDFSSSRRNEGGVKYINQKGIVTFDRKIKKDAFYYYKAQWSNEPFVHICSKRFEKRVTDQITIKIYTNLPEVELNFAEGSLSGKNDGNGCVLFSNVALNEGKNEFKVKASLVDGICVTDSAVFLKVDQPEESYTLPDSDAGSAVKNWFLDEDSLIREGYYSVEDSTYDIWSNPETCAVLNEFTPETVQALNGDTGIPMGLSLMRVLSYNKKVAETVDMKKLNDRLNQIKRKI